MSEQGYRAPTFRSILAGILLATVLILAIAGIATVVKALGVPLLVIPSALGITNIAGPSDVRTFNLADGLGTVEFRQAGRYAIYSADWGLLETTEVALQSHAAPWLEIRSAANGASVPVTYVERGLRPYDSPLAPGRPVFTFEIPIWGLYQFDHPGKAAIVALAPDYTTGKERQIAQAMGLQLLLIALPFAILFGRRWNARRQEKLRAQAERRKQAEALWQPKQIAGRRFRR